MSTANLASIAQQFSDNDVLVDTVRSLRKRPENVLGLLVRELTREEIAIMEGRGCRADDWSLVMVAQDFDPFRVRRTHLVGRCVLGRFRGECEVRPGISLPAGIYDSTLIDVQVGNDCLLENVRFCARAVIDHQAVLFDVGSLLSGTEVSFACDQWLQVGPETGGREVPLWPGMTVAKAHAIATELTDQAGQEQIRQAHEDYLAQLRGNRCWVGRGAVIRHTTRIADAYIGPYGIIDQAIDLGNVALCSQQSAPTVITAASVTDALLGPGVAVCGGSIVRHSALIEHCTIDLNAVVQQSVIGANAQVAKGEITASIVGPFTGLHHQSLLIGALWPAGKGNIAYGAMVGSNHTGRAPDQEIWPGEGAFFGLGVNIKFPSDFSQAPYLVIGSGVATLAQRVAFPFSLIATPIETVDQTRVPRAYNEILPAWGLYANAYAIVRSEEKYRQRDRTGRGDIPHQVLRPEIVGLIRSAWERLTEVASEDPERLYLEHDIPGLGKNFLREKTRRKAVEAYETALKRYALRVLLAHQEGHLQLPGAAVIAQELAEQLLPERSLAQRLDALIAIEEENVEIVKRAKLSDDRRGQGIIPGYEQCHPTVDNDAVVRSAVTRLQATKQRVQAYLSA